MRWPNALRLPVDVLAVLSVTIAGSFGNGAVAPLLGDIRESFGVSFAAMGLLTSGFAMARILVDLPGGSLADRVQPRTLFYTGTVIAMAGVALTAMAPVFAVLLVGRILNGLGASLGSIAAMAYVSRATRPAERGKALGAASAATQTGGSLSPAVVGLAASIADWRVGMALTIVPLVGALLVVRLYVAKVSFGSAPRRARRRGVIGMVYAPRRLLPVSVLTVLISLSIFGFKAALLPLYGTEGLKLDAAVVGIAITLSTALRMPVSIASGSISDRYGRIAVFVPGALLMALVSILVPLSPNAVLYVAFTAIYAFGGSTSPMVNAMVVDRASKDRLGAALGTNAFFRDVAIVGMPVALGAVMDAGGFLTAGAVLAGFALTAAVVALVIGDTSDRASGRRAAKSPASDAGR